MSLNNHHASVPDLKIKFENACGVSLSARTVQGWPVVCGESKFNLYGSDGKWYIRGRKNKVFQPDCISPTVKFSASQMVWGIISSKGVGHLKFITGIVPQFIPASWRNV